MYDDVTQWAVVARPDRVRAKPGVFKNKKNKKNKQNYLFIFK
jgi:hypothetical protein